MHFSKQFFFTARYTALNLQLMGFFGVFRGFRVRSSYLRFANFNYWYYTYYQKFGYLSFLFFLRSLYLISTFWQFLVRIPAAKWIFFVSSQNWTLASQLFGWASTQQHSVIEHNPFFGAFSNYFSQQEYQLIKQVPMVKSADFINILTNDFLKTKNSGMLQKPPYRSVWAGPAIDLDKNFLTGIDFFLPPSQKQAVAVGAEFFYFRYFFFLTQIYGKKETKFAFFSGNLKNQTLKKLSVGNKKKVSTGLRREAKMSNLSHI